MPSLAADYDDYSIGRAITGDAVLYDLNLTGWGNQLATVSAGGVMFWGLSGTTLTFYSDSARSVGVCSGTVTSGAATLTALNASGVTGTVKCTYTNGVASTGRVVVAYGDEPDLEDVLQDSADFLTSSQWRGVARFEKAFRNSKRELDNWITGVLRGTLPIDPVSLRLDLTAITNPYVLRTVHAMLTAHVLLRRQGSLDEQGNALSVRYRKDATTLFDSLGHELTIGETLRVDARVGGGFIKVGRAS